MYGWKHFSFSYHVFVWFHFYLGLLNLFVLDICTKNHQLENNLNLCCLYLFRCDFYQSWRIKMLQPYSFLLLYGEKVIYSVWFSICFRTTISLWELLHLRHADRCILVISSSSWIFYIIVNFLWTFMSLAFSFCL